MKEIQTLGFYNFRQYNFYILLFYFRILKAPTVLIDQFSELCMLL